MELIISRRKFKLESRILEIKELMATSQDTEEFKAEMKNLVDFTSKIDNKTKNKKAKKFLRDVEDYKNHKVYKWQEDDTNVSSRESSPERDLFQHVPQECLPPEDTYMEQDDTNDWTQTACQAVDLTMMHNAFDDQYLGCARQMEREMAAVLEQEKAYKPLGVMWYLAEQRWAVIKQQNVFPPGFKDEYGISVTLYTKESPFPLYQQLNRNVSVAGRSRSHYMERFHFKALHFYLTRALQVLGGGGGGDGCAGGSQAYRGSWMKYKNVSSDLRFGQFASSSLSRKTAQRFGVNTMFTILTCFGVNVEVFSDFKEEEVLIPVAETFQTTKKSETSYVLTSSGRQCSYYNCAYLGGEKRKQPICSSAPGGLLNGDRKFQLILPALNLSLSLLLVSSF
ncbi:ecto-ADP-ribosyltransferase 5-like [Mantella aurantiaca]